MVVCEGIMGCGGADAATQNRLQVILCLFGWYHYFSFLLESHNRYNFFESEFSIARRKSVTWITLPSIDFSTNTAEHLCPSHVAKRRRRVNFRLLAFNSIPTGLFHVITVFNPWLAEIGFTKYQPSTHLQFLTFIVLPKVVEGLGAL